MPSSFKYFKSLRSHLYEVVFGTETPAGRTFDLVLLWAILISILTVMLESVKEINADYEDVFTTLEWTFTILFSIEYLLRLFISHKPLKYAFSYLGLIDLIALLPTYLAIFISGGSYLVVIRAFRLLRVFRILKLTRYLGEAQVLWDALKSSRQKIVVFLLAVSTVVVIMGTLMYMIEGGENGFTSIPRSIYWAVVTITTVGYGDIAPQTVLGQAFAALLMLMGYAIIAVPTGIVTAQIAVEEIQQRQDKKRLKNKLKECPNCHSDLVGDQPNYCVNCGLDLKKGFK